MKDEDIDLSDIPEVTEAQMEGAVLRIGGKPVEAGKQGVHLILDRSILEYFKARAGDRSYQALINEALMEYIRNRNLKEEMRQIVREELARSKDGLS
jgi:uncharacterized protein (DUF4415 family)